MPEKLTPAPNVTVPYRPELRTWWCGKKATCWAENVPLMNAATGTGTVGAAAENNSRILCASPPFLGLRYTYPD